jgi:hypothetical protein
MVTGQYMSVQIWSRIEITVNVGEGSSCRIDSTSRCNRNHSVWAVHVRAGAVMLSEQYVCKCRCGATVLPIHVRAGALQLLG